MSFFSWFFVYNEGLEVSLPTIKLFLINMSSMLEPLYGISGPNGSWVVFGGKI